MYIKLNHTEPVLRSLHRFIQDLQANDLRFIHWEVDARDKTVDLAVEVITSSDIKLVTKLVYDIFKTDVISITLPEGAVEQDMRLR